MSTKSVELAPNNAENLGEAGMVMTKSGHPERAIELDLKAIRLSPFYRPGRLRGLGLAYRMSGRLDKAIACYRESLKGEQYLTGYVNLASTLGELGLDEEAGEAARDVLRLEPKFSISAYTAGLSYRNPADIERIAAGLRKAGLPE